MQTIPQSPPAGKSTALARTTHACPCCRTPLQRWNLTIAQPPAQVFWCAGCRRPVCLDAPARPEVQYALGLPVDGGRVAVPEQWLRDWCVQAQITLELLAPEGPQRKGEIL